jgi:ubiquinone/menaquinone biosynthesis C-methylase UbiE
MPEPIRDHWAQWVLHRRHGGDAQQQQSNLEYLLPVRDHILQNARIAADDVVLDVGTGDGLIAFGALDQVGERGRVILSDISQDCMAYCQDLVQRLGVAERCQLICSPADDLTALAAASVDVITTRSVLIFVAAKQRAFQEFYRVLKPNGRLSIFEPINRYFGIPGPPGYDVAPIQDIWHKISVVYERLQPSGANPMVDFDERDLLTMAERAGFRETHLELQVRIMPMPPLRWEVWVRSSPHPLLPTLEEAMHEALTMEEMRRCVTHLQPLMESGQGTWRDAVAYLWAVKR